MRELVLLSLIASLHPVSGGESCCAKKLRLRKLEFIPDVNATPPDEDHDGRPRMIPDPYDVKPDGWDDDEDGPWEPNLTENPEYRWKPPLVQNPGYDPPSYLEELRSEILKALPWIIVGIVATAALEAMQLPVHKLATLLQRSGPLGGAALGLATPLCSCGALPVAASFAARGVPIATVVAFLVASQSAGLDSAAITWGLLGPKATLFRLAGALILAAVAGFTVGNLGSSDAQDSTQAVQPAGKAIGMRRKHRKKEALLELEPPPRQSLCGETCGLLTTFCTAAVTGASEVFPSVLLGLAMSTAAVHSMPALVDGRATYEGIALMDESMYSGATEWSRSLFVRCAVLAASVPLQLCEHSTVTVAAGLQKAGAGPGLAFAFLLAAPAVNLPSLIFLSTPPRRATNGFAQASAQRIRAALVAIALVVTALGLSVLVDLVGWDLLVEQEAALDSQSLNLAAPIVDASPWLALLLAAAALGKAVSAKAGPTSKAHDACCTQTMTTACNNKARTVDPEASSDLNDKSRERAVVEPKLGLERQHRRRAVSRSPARRRKNGIRPNEQ